MPQAEVISITTRRNALRLGGAATVATVLTLPIAAARPSTVMSLHAALVAACQEQDRVSAIGDFLPDGITAESRAYDVLADAAGDAWWAVARQLPNVPARTPAELRLKADALRIVLEQCVCVEIGQTIDDIADAGEIEDILAWSLARDVQNFLGV